MKVLSMFAAVALFSGIAATNAAEPVALTDAQMDGVTAGQIAVGYPPISAVVASDAEPKWAGHANVSEYAFKDPYKLVSIAPTATSDTVAVAY